MVAIIDWNLSSEIEKINLLKRPQQQNWVQQQVKAIIDEVKTEGDRALLKYTQEFDDVCLSTLSISSCESETTQEAFEAIKACVQTITTYHQAMLPKPCLVETAPGISIQRLFRPIERVGLYVPGGRQTPLISSVLMQAIPANLAGCPIRILCTPPNKAGQVDPNLLVAARLCGIKTVIPIGGAQAIAAMAYGTETVPKVNKLFGPGNAFVTEAKLQVSLDPDGAAIDLPAGPSELMILADNFANCDWIAADLLAQAEHGTDSQVLCICEDKTIANTINDALTRQITRLTRSSIVEEALKSARIIVCSDKSKQLQIVNQYAPEHLIINRKDAALWVDDIQSCGTVFLGPWAAETMGDYITGSNHILPTYGYAKSYSGLSTQDFMKSITVQSINETGVRESGYFAETLARLEGLDAHANAIAMRLTYLKEMCYD